MTLTPGTVEGPLRRRSTKCIPVWSASSFVSERSGRASEEPEGLYLDRVVLGVIELRAKCPRDADALVGWEKSLVAAPAEFLIEGLVQANRLSDIPCVNAGREHEH